jgi:NTP pyrophosphatase (non-canonical NTP hydrolase)
MTVQELQSEVDLWIQQHGVRYFNELTNVALLMEEVGEFARLMARRYGEQSFKQGTEPTDLKDALTDEMGDIVFVLTCLANQTGIDLTGAIEKNLLKKSNRDNQRHHQNPKLQEE